MQRNVGVLDSLLRIWGGLFLLGTGINRDSQIMMALGAGKVAEGVTRFCPLLYILGLSTAGKDNNNTSLFREEKRIQTPQAQYEPQVENGELKVES